MKIKQLLCICRPDKFLSGDFIDYGCFSLMAPDSVANGWVPPEWVPLQVIEIEVDNAEARRESMKIMESEFSKQETQLRAKLDLISQSRKELFSITYQPEPIKPTPTDLDMNGEPV
jgi:hypothetical protein